MDGLSSGLVALVEGPVTSGGTDDESAFDDVGKDEDAPSVLGEIQRFGIGSVALAESGA